MNEDCRIQLKFFDSSQEIIAFEHEEWIIDTAQDIHPVNARGVPEAIYSPDEIKKLRELSNEDLKDIHKVKEIFENSKIEEVKRKYDADR